MSLADSPQDAVVATQYKDKRQEFDKTARQWTAEYADPERLKKDKVAKIMEMGFSEEQAVQALEQVGWDEAEAIQMLIS